MKQGVSSFESISDDVTDQLAKLPATPRRKKALNELNLMHPKVMADNLKAWYDIELFKGVSKEDIEFIHKYFNRRHLLTHKKGVVGQEYIDRTGDVEFKAGRKLRIRSNEVKRLITLCRKPGENIFNDLESMTTDF